MLPVYHRSILLYTALERVRKGFLGRLAHSGGGRKACDKIEEYQCKPEGTLVPGKAGKLMEVYPSDLSDDEWAMLEPLLPPGKPGGRPREVDMRAILNGIFYVLRSGCA